VIAEVLGNHSLDDALADLEGAFEGLEGASGEVRLKRLQRLVGKLSALVACPKCRRASRACPPDRGRVARLQRWAARACGELEKAMARLGRRPEELAYFQQVTQCCREEAARAAITRNARVLFIGCGAFPLSALALAEQIGCRVTALDSDPEAVLLARGVIEARGLADRVDVRLGHGEKTGAAGYSHVLVASLVGRKRALLARLAASSAAGTVLLVRFGNGLRRLFNYGLQAPPPPWSPREVMRQKAGVYNTMICKLRPSFGKVLLVGGGPVAVSMGVLLRRQHTERLDLMVRRTPAGEMLARETTAAGGVLTANATREEFTALSGAFAPDALHVGADGLRERYDMIGLCVPADACAEALDSLLERGCVGPTTTVVLPSSGLGAGSQVGEALRRRGLGRTVVASLSNFFAAAKPDGSRARVMVKGVKRKVYLGLSRPHPPTRAALHALLRSAGVEVGEAASTLEAESRNITMFVHPPLCMNRYALEAIFRRNVAPAWLYKIHPEGPITLDAMHAMVALFEEVMEVLGRLGIPRFNLMRFLAEDNYPVPTEYLPTDEHERFDERSHREKAMLLFVYYAGLLVDPWSTPDAEGRFHPFSAVPMPRLRDCVEGPERVPRIPLEDYRGLLVLEGLAAALGVAVPTVARMNRTFEAFAGDLGLEGLQADARVLGARLSRGA